MLIQHNGYTFTKKSAHHQERPISGVSGMGIGVTAGNDTKGSWSATRTLTLDFDCQLLRVIINNGTATSTERNLLVDIGSDESGGTSYNVIIPDLIAGAASYYRFGGYAFEFPLYIPNGTKLSARSKATASGVFQPGVFLQALGGSTDPRFHRLGSRVEAVGIVTTSGNAQGTPVTPGTTSDGSWTSLGTTVNRCFHWNVAAHQKTNAYPDTSAHLDLAFGADPKTIICENARYLSVADESATLWQGSNGFCQVPAGETIYGRAQDGATTLTSFSMAAWGTY